MAEIRAAFFQECEDQLAALEEGLLRMEAGLGDRETIDAAFRAVHSIKGGAGIFALDALVRFAHGFETTLDAIRSGRMVASPPVLSLLLHAADALADLVQAARGGDALSDAKTGDSVAAFEALASDLAPEISVAVPAAPPAPLGAARTWVIHLTPKASLYAHGNEVSLLLRDLKALGAAEIEVDTSALPALAQMDPEAAYLSWTITLTTRQDVSAIRSLFEFVENDCDLDLFERPDFSFFDAAPATPAAEDDKDVPAALSVNPVETIAFQAETPSAVSATIRVDLDRLDRMIDLVGELVITEAMLSQRASEARLARSSGVVMALEGLEALTREIQDSVMAIRAQPVRAVFQRMPRLVRELAAQTGKQVRLTVEGEATEVDKTIIERIADPLTHMIRNAIDHGLELPESRIASGKPVEGVVRLTALHRSGRIVIMVADDGAGINRGRVRQKAVEAGVINADAQLTDDEIDRLIFLPGLTTARTLSDISGRGVGLDVVRRAVQAMGGRIAIASRPGQGSTFTLSLPLTLAVLDGMVVKTAGQTLIVPLAAVLETLRPSLSDIYPLDNLASVLVLRGSYVPIIDVAQRLQFTCQDTVVSRCVALLVESERGNRAVLLVDEIQGQRQVVIKSIEANYRAVYGIAAATVMGDGQVALILDIDTVVSTGRENGRLELTSPLPQAC